MTETTDHRPTLVLGGIGKTGRRLVERLTRRHIPVRIGSRSAGLPFDWDQPSTWGPVFQDVEAFEEILMDSGADWTVLRASFFNQNFSAEATGRDIAYARIPPEDFAAYARVTAASGVWTPNDQPNPESPR
jgi:uncharacterized protein YbjT (DUF2867 family)